MRVGVLLGCLFFLFSSVCSAEIRRRGKSSEELLFQGIDLYEDGQMEDAMENFMEVIRMGASPEEVALAKEYVNRISYRMAGKPIAQPKAPSQSAVGLSAPPHEAPAAQSSRPPASKTAESVPPLPEEMAPAGAKKPPMPKPTPEALTEYVKLKLHNRRKELIEAVKKKDAVGVVLKGTDKFLALTIPESLLFAKETSFKRQAGDLLKILAESAYYHPKHLIRIYPAQTQGRSSISNLQRATILSSYLTGRGMAPARIEVDLEGQPRFSIGPETEFPKALQQMSRNREATMMLVFEEFANPFHTHYFFTKYLPRQSSKSEYPSLYLGVSREKIDARIGQGMVIELFASGNPQVIAHWSLRLVAPDKSTVWTHEGKGSILETFYFEGKRDAIGDFEVLPTGRYTLEAEALDVGGGKVRSTKVIDVVGQDIKKVVSQPKPASAAKPKPKPAVKSGQAKAAKPKPKPKAKAVKPKAASITKAAAPKAVTAAAAVAAPVGDAGKGVGKTVPVEASEQSSATSFNLTNFKIAFGPNDTKVSKEQVAMLNEVAQAARLHPAQRLTLIGAASPDEHNAKVLAEQRAREVAKILSGDFGVAGSRMVIESGTGETGQRYVEVFVEQ
ncbi:MAG: OmpA family protein [Elusimicrobia bacterium]|nr:OmpA family protein [Elusimicrobiota bacterium]